MQRVNLKAVGTGAVLILVALFADKSAAQWLNETNQPGEADLVNIQLPSTLSVQASQKSELVYGLLSKPD